MHREKVGAKRKAGHASNIMSRNIQPQELQAALLFGLNLHVANTATSRMLLTCHYIETLNDICSQAYRDRPGHKAKRPATKQRSGT